MTKLSNLEKIEAAWAMGFSARIFHEINGTVMGFGINSIYIRYDEGMIREIGLEDKYGMAYINELEITGYLYAGQLAGNEPIPEGQRFRLRSRGLIGIYASTWDKKLRIKFNEFDEMYYASRDEVEPVFD